MGRRTKHPFVYMREFMKKEGFLAKLKRTWYAMTMKNKITVFIGAVFMTMALSLLLNVWVAKFSMVDFRGILEENAKSSELVQALEAESDIFSEYVKSPDEEKKHQLNDAKNRTKAAVDELTYDYHAVGELRYAQTWSIRNAYAVYVEKRDRLLASGGESENYIRELYEVYEMQMYLQKYAGNLMSMTIEAGNETYKAKLPDLVSVPVSAMVLAMVLFWGILATARMMHRAIVVPVMKLADTSKRIAANDFFVEDVKVENKDELGDLVRAFNKMKFATGEYIVALEEKRKTLDLLHQEEMERLAIERELENMKFDLLKNQINPHFLFNTLNVIAGMANLEDATTSEKMIRALSDLFRYNLKTKEAEVPLSQEIKVMEDYVYLQQMRFGKRVSYDIHCSVDKERTMVPVFTFQPIVENAIIHGICKKEEGGTIRIRIGENEDDILITIGDTGVGMEEAMLEKLRSQLERNEDYPGIGLGNVFRRVKSMYQDGKVEIYSREMVGTVIKLALPKKGVVK